MYAVSRFVSDPMDLKKRFQYNHRKAARGPRLERRNAVKNIDYEATGVSLLSWVSGSSSSSDESLRTRSLDLSPSTYSNQTSFRIHGGVEGEVDILCRSLGLSGPEDFAIPAAAWEARKARSSSDFLPQSRLVSDSSPSAPVSPPRPIASDELKPNDGVQVREEDGDLQNSRPVRTAAVGDYGIKGTRPPLLYPPTRMMSPLAPPPSMSLPVLEKVGSVWDLVKSFAPTEDERVDEGWRRQEFVSDEDKDEEEEEEEEEEQEEGKEEVRMGETVEDAMVSCSFSTSNDDDSSSTTTETMFVISPNARFKRKITSWMRGGLLGSGSFGTVYEGISDDGFFFAVKEVSLLGQGNDAKQCIAQLEQEIALLSQFEHENIVQYYGTDKEDAKLYIFIQLVTQGSLASLYQRYHLRDSQVSAYTRQILHGLNYLHERNVIHRDIKCANILVDASGSVKLADFGLAKEITKINGPKSCKGSVYWMAPEVVKPKQTYGRAADIWSLGCTVLEMLTRQIPYPNVEWIQALYRIGHGEPPPIPSSLSEDARDFITKCVQVNPEDRPSASQLLEHPFVRRTMSGSLGSDNSSHRGERRI